jgi:hypothetical protein
MAFWSWFTRHSPSRLRPGLPYAAIVSIPAPGDLQRSFTASALAQTKWPLAGIVSGGTG